MKKLMGTRLADLTIGQCVKGYAIVGIISMLTVIVELLTCSNWEWICEWFDSRFRKLTTDRMVDEVTRH